MTFKKGGTFKSVILKYDINGNILNKFAIGNLTDTGSLNMFYVEASAIQFST